MIEGEILHNLMSKQIGTGELASIVANLSQNTSLPFFNPNISNAAKENVNMKKKLFRPIIIQRLRINNEGIHNYKYISG